MARYPRRRFTGPPVVSNGLGAFALALTGLFFASAAPAWAQDSDEILSWDVVLDVAGEGRIQVTERIRIRVGGGDLTDGLVRHYDTSRWRRGGIGWIEIPFRFRGALMDGRPTSYRETATGGEFGASGVRVRVGPSLRTAPGTHAYELTWETERRVAFGPVNDTLAWDVTGYDATVPIRSASIQVRVPAMTTPPVEVQAGVGPREGAMGPTEPSEPLESGWDPADGAWARWTRTLEPGEGLAFRMVLPKWILHVPSYNTERQWFWLDWRGWIEAGWALALVMGVYLLMWSRVGVDRPGGPLVVQYDPPPGLSPAAVGYLSRRRYDPSLYAAAVVGLAIKGMLRIHRSGSTWRVERGDSRAELTSDERAVHRALLADTGTVTLDLESGPRLARGATALRRALSVQLERAFFVANRRWWLGGLIVSAASLGVLAWRWRFEIHVGSWVVVVLLALCTLVTASLLVRAAGYLRHGRAGGGRPALAESAVLSLLTVPLAVGTVGLAVAVLEMVPGHLVVAGLAIGIVNAAFYHLLERPTLGGRRILDRVQGFRRFLTRVEGDRLARPSGDDAAPDLYERYLPHAIALGIEKRWASRFSALLTPPVATDAADGYRQDWYAGEGGEAGLDDAAAALGSDLPRALDRDGLP